jgi:hypothetical protein
MFLFHKDPIKEGKRLAELMKINTDKLHQDAIQLKAAAMEKIRKNKERVAAIEEESLALFANVNEMADVPYTEPVPESKVNDLFTPDVKVPTLKDNFKVLGGIGKKLIGRGNTVLSDGLLKLTHNLK